MNYDNPEIVTRQVSGVYSRGEDGYGLRPNIGIRGTSPDRSKKITLMEDGLLFGPAPYAAPAAYYFPLITRMELVRVIKGPGAVSFGPQTIGGAIDLVTRAIPTEEMGAIDVAVGGYGYGKVHGYYGASTARSGYIIEGVHLRSTGFKQLDGGGDTGFAKNEWMWKGRYLLSTDPRAFQTVGLKLGYSDEDSRESYLGLSDADFRANPLRRYVASRFDRMQYHRTQVVATYHARFADAFTLDAAVYRNDLSRTWRKFNRIGGCPPISEFNPIPCTSPGSDVTTILANPTSAQNARLYCVLTGACDTSTDPSSLQAQTIYIGPNRREFVSEGAQVVGGWQGRSGPVEHRVEAGVRAHYDRIDRLHTEDGFLMRGGQLVPNGEPTITTANARAWVHALALHLTDAATWGPVTVTPGARLELIDTWERDRLAGRAGAGAGAARAPPRPRRLRRVDADAGPVCGRLSRLLAGDSIGDGCRDAGARGQLRGGRASVAAAAARRGDRLLQRLPEPDHHVHDRDVRANAGGDAEQRRPRPHLRSGAVPAWRGGGAARLLHPGDGGVHVHAHEAAGDVHVGRIRRWVMVDPGDELPFVPRHAASATVAFETPRAALAVAGSYISAMRERAGQGPATTTEPFTDPSLIFDVTARVSVTQSGLFYVNVRNVFNDADIAARLPFGARPVAPRWVQVGLKWSL